MATELQVMCIALQSENVSAIIPSIQAEQLSRDSSDETPLQEKVGQESCSHKWSSKVSDAASVTSLLRVGMSLVIAYVNYYQTKWELRMW